MYDENLILPDKIISAVTYMTGGLVGILWLIFCAITKHPISKYVMFNIYQAAFLGFFIYISGMLLAMIYNILIMIPIINILANFINIYLFTPIFYNWSIVGVLILSVYVYLVVFSLLGKLGKLPWISGIILYQLGRF